MLAYYLLSGSAKGHERDSFAVRWLKRGNAALLRCQRTLELAPVRAGLVASPGLYRWSSYRHNALGDRDPLVAPHAHWLKLAGNDAGRRERWQAMVAASQGDALR